MTMNVRAIALAIVLSVSATEARADVFRVTSTSNAGPGSLRQAILDSRAVPGPHVIEFDLPSGPGPAVIMVEDAFLPPLKGPLVLRGKAAAPANQLPVGRGAAAGRAAGAPAAPAPTAPAGRGRGQGAAPGSLPMPVPRVVMDGSRLVRPRTPDDCPGATFTFNEQTGLWETSRVQGSGPNVRGYFGAGLAIHDTSDVEVSGVELRNFCIGVAVVRSHDVILEDIKVMDSHGAAGVIFTGDDGAAGSSGSAHNNMLLDSELVDNGDGFEFTRGARDSILQGTTITLTRPLPSDGNAVEYASSGDNNALMGNTFEKYVITAVTVGSGRNHTIRDNRIVGNAADGMRVGGENALIFGNMFANNGGNALTVSGARTRVVDNVFTGNGGRAVVVGASGITVFRNSMHGNVRLAIDVATPTGGRGRSGPPADGAGAAAATGRRGGGGRGGAATGRQGGPLPAPQPVILPNAPVLLPASRWTASEIVLNGTLEGKPGERYQVQLYLSREPDRHQGEEHGFGEGEMYIGTASATPDAAGRASFSLMLKIPDIFGEHRVAYATATATAADGSTSKFSRSLELRQVR